MTEIHNAELTQDIVIGAVAAWLEQTNDSCLKIDVSFQRNISHASNQDLIAFTKIDILKANDFQPMKRGQHAWIDEDQKLLGEMTVNKPNGKDHTPARTYKLKSTQTAKQPFSAESDSHRDKKITGDTLKHVAVQWDLPSAEYYPVRYEEHIRRNLNIRKFTELETAQEVPAVREKGEANDQTDQDCLTHPADLHSSRESLSFTIESKKERSPIRQQLSPAPVKAAAIPKKQEEPVKDVPKVEEVKKVEEKLPLQEEPVPKLEEKKDEAKVVELKREETPAIAVKNPVKKVQISTKRHPDSGELTILSEKDGIVSFTCSTRHRTKKSKKKDNEQNL